MVCVSGQTVTLCLSHHAPSIDDARGRSHDCGRIRVPRAVPCQDGCRRGSATAALPSPETTSSPGKRSSALLMAVVHGAFHGGELRATGGDLSRWMHRLNTLLIQRSAENRFVTLFCGTFDARRGTLAIRAGISRWSSRGSRPTVSTLPCALVRHRAEISDVRYTTERQVEADPSPA